MLALGVPDRHCFVSEEAFCFLIFARVVWFSELHHCSESRLRVLCVTISPHTVYFSRRHCTLRLLRSVNIIISKERSPKTNDKMTTHKTWDGNSMSQEDMMMKDTVLVLDDDDNVIGSASKRKSHEFTVDQPRAILHRAFSVFVFDESTGELLLQQRASSKITFPNVRTSTTVVVPL